MSIAVTIEGSILPCEDLPTGHVRTVEFTESVRQRIEAGFYLLRGPRRTLAELDEYVAETEATADAAQEPVPPAGNATTEEWLQFLTDQGIEVPTDDDGETPGREVLKGIWQNRDGQR